MPQTILIIDDNPMVREVVQVMLNNAGYRAIAAEDGPSGIRAFAAHTFDAAIIDVDMPVMNGVDVCRELTAQATAAHRPFVAWIMTGVVRPELVTSALAAGAVGVLAKPFTKRELLARFEATLVPQAANPLAG